MGFPGPPRFRSGVLTEYTDSGLMYLSDQVRQLFPDGARSKSQMSVKRCFERIRPRGALGGALA